MDYYTSATYQPDTTGKHCSWRCFAPLLRHLLLPAPLL